MNCRPKMQRISFGVQGPQLHTKLTAVGFIEIQSSMLWFTLPNFKPDRCTLLHAQFCPQTSHCSDPTPLDTVSPPLSLFGGRLAPPRPSHALLHVDRRLLRSAGRRFRVTQSLQGVATPRDRQRWQESVYRAASGLCSHARTAHSATRQTAHRQQDWRRFSQVRSQNVVVRPPQSPTWTNPGSYQSKIH